MPDRRHRVIRPRYPLRAIPFVACLVAGLLPPAGRPAAAPPERGEAVAAPVNDDADGRDPAFRDEAFKKLVTNVRLTGNFTIDGEDPGKLRRESYEITGATRLGRGDSWALMARITYGDVDLTVPVPVEVKWAGDTPVIGLDRVAIPGMGTFSARVVLDGTRYAGTWSHDAKGGHLFGRIEPLEPADDGAR